MATTAPRRLRLVSRPAAGLSLTGMPGMAIGLGVLLALSAAARATAIGAGYWIDEGLTVGLSSFGLLEIPSMLRQDGSPPLYYILLHLWMGVAGDGEIATHMLSLIFALLSVVAAPLDD